MSIGRRRWSIEEDSLLRKLVKGPSQTDWSEISAQLNGRTEQDCRRRWHVKSRSQLKAGAWTHEEDKKLRAAVGEQGLKWTAVAELVGSRNGDQCFKRWNDALNPELEHGPWSSEDDGRLLEKVEEMGRTWKQIAANHFTNRSPLALKNRYSLLMRRTRAARNNGSQESATQGGTGIREALIYPESSPTPPSRTPNITKDTNSDLGIEIGSDVTMDFDLEEPGSLSEQNTSYPWFPAPTHIDLRASLPDFSHLSFSPAPITPPNGMVPMPPYIGTTTEVPLPLGQLGDCVSIRACCPRSKLSQLLHAMMDIVDSVEVGNPIPSTPP